MPSPPVKAFVCHSAIGDPDTEALIRALETELDTKSGSKFACFVDWTELQPGTAWREPINTWLEHCDAAVLVLNRKAIDSPFVAYEVSELMRRRRTSGGRFLVIPVHVRNPDPALDVGYGVLQSSRLGPWLVNEVNAVVFDPAAHAANAVARQAHIDATVAAIRSELDAAAATLRPVSPQLQAVVDLLKRVRPTALVTKALSDLDVTVRPLRAVTDDQYVQLALALRSLGLTSARPVIQTLRGDLCDPDNHWKEEHLRRLLDLLAHFWVDPHSAATICETALGAQQQRNLALATTRPETARLHVMRACPKAPVDNEWQFAAVQVVGGEELGDPAYLSAKVRQGLIERFKTTPEELAEDLQAFEDIDNPVFAALPAMGVTGSSLTRIRQDFGSVTFLFLTGTAAPALPLVEAAVRVVIPAVEPKDEDAFHESYRKVWKVLRAQCG